MVTVLALALKLEGLVQRAGILDCDQHYGDGTVETIAMLGIDWIRHVSQEHWSIDETAIFIDQLPKMVRSLANCDLLIYQAGADQHLNDQLGGFLTTTNLAERDRIVFSVAKSIDPPLFWNLAGGYQVPPVCVLEIHRNTMTACTAEYL